MDEAENLEKNGYVLSIKFFRSKNKIINRFLNFFSIKHAHVNQVRRLSIFIQITYTFILRAADQSFCCKWDSSYTEFLSSDVNKDYTISFIDMVFSALTLGFFSMCLESV